MREGVIVMHRVVISFTSYPVRIKAIDKVLDSIVKQTILPDKIILFLSLEQFYGYDEFPDFTRYKKYGFEICWCKGDLKSHKKYYYVMQQYPDDIIITIDDDIYYKKTMIEELLTYHKVYPEAVITRRAHLITWTQNENIAPYEKWYKETLRYVGIPRMDLVSTGCSGVLYPPHIFKPEIFNKEIFLEKAPYADDIWLKVMELYSEIPVVLANQFFTDRVLEEYSSSGLYCNQNADGGNDIQFHALLDAYNSDGNENTLIKRLAADGKLMSEDLERIRKKDMLQIIDEYLKILDNQESVLIYGAGDVAGKIYKIFEETGRLKKISAFIVNCIEENKKKIGNIKVKSYLDFVDSREKIIIGLCEMKQDEIYQNLITENIDEGRIIRFDSVINKLIALI